LSTSDSLSSDDDLIILSFSIDIEKSV